MKQVLPMTTNLSPNDNLDLQSAELDVKQKQNALSDAQDNLS